MGPFKKDVRWASLDAGARGWIRRQKHRRRGVLGRGHSATGKRKASPGGGSGPPDFQWKMLEKTGLTEPCVVTLPFITGESSISIYFYGPFSIATLNCQRVTGHVVPSWIYLWVIMSDPLHKIHKTTKRKAIRLWVAGQHCGIHIQNCCCWWIFIPLGIFGPDLENLCCVCFIGKIAYEWTEIGDFPLPCQITRTYLLGLLGTKDPINILKIVIWGQCG